MFRFLKKRRVTPGRRVPAKKSLVRLELEGLEERQLLASTQFISPSFDGAGTSGEAPAVFAILQQPHELWHPR